MKNQASLDLRIVDNPINDQVNNGCISIRATTNGVVVVNSDGTSQTINQKHTINGVSADASGKFTITADDIGAAQSTHTHKYSDITDAPASSSDIVLGIIKAYDPQTKLATVQEANNDWSENTSGTVHENIVVP